MQSGVANSSSQGKYEAALEQFRGCEALAAEECLAREFYRDHRDQNSAASTRPTKITKTPSASTLSSADPHKNLAFNYLGKEQYELAEKQLKTALALDSADPFVHYYSAILYLDTSRDQEAMIQIKPAESLLASDPIAALMAIKACLRSNAPEEALRLIQLLEQNSTLSVEQEYEIAELLNQKQMYAESAARFQRIVDMQPTPGRTSTTLP